MGRALGILCRGLGRSSWKRPDVGPPWEELDVVLALEQRSCIQIIMPDTEPFLLAARSGLSPKWQACRWKKILEIKKKKKKMASHYKYVISYKLAREVGKSQNKALRWIKQLVFGGPEKSGEWPGKWSVWTNVSCVSGTALCVPLSWAQSLWLLQFILISWFLCPLCDITKSWWSELRVLAKMF